MKRVFTVLSAVALVNMLALGGVLGYAKSKHWLTKERIRKAFAALQEDEHHEVAPTTMPAMAKAPQHEAPSDERMRRMRELDEITRTELDRRTREIQDGWKLLETQQLTLVRDRESLEGAKAALAEMEKKKAEQTGESGLQKEAEIIGGLKAKQAKELLRQKQDADVVALLKGMDDRKVRKIVGECKSEEERHWIGRILEMIRDGRAAQAEVLNAGT